MKRLRHPIRAIKEPFGKAGLVVAVIALMLALTGAAFAAAGLNGKQKKEVEKIAKKYAGKPGAPGAQGPVGPAGKDGSSGGPGPQGATGAAGATGKTGPTGVTGAAGESPKIAEEFEPGEPGCEENGGFVYEVEGSGESSPEICNGAPGAPGPQGEPWTAGGTLPPGATETGVWVASGSGQVGAGLSFPIPLASSSEIEVHFKKAGGPEDPLCPGKPVNPTAAPGVLCIYYPTPIEASSPYVNAPEQAEPDNSLNTVGHSGTNLYWKMGPEGFAVGSFAITGCAEESSVPFACPGF
jgi:hypothetical protein